MDNHAIEVIDVTEYPEEERRAWGDYFRACICASSHVPARQLEAFQHFHSVKLGALYAVELRKAS